MSALHVTTPGSSLVRKDGSLAVISKGSVIGEFPIHKVRLVVLHPGTQVTGPALRLILRTNGRILWLTKSGRVEGITHPAQWARTRRYEGQLALREKPALRLTLAKAIVTGKVKSQIAYLRLRATWAHKQRIPAEPFLEAAEGLVNILAKIQKAPDHRVLRGLEGQASRQYFQTLGAYWRSKGVRFYGRRAHPPRDLANACLSYGYGVLQSWVIVAAMGADLLPSPGVLHQDELHYAAIVYDLMEEFRVAAVDQVVSRLLTNRTLGPKQTERKSNAVYLTSEGRTRLVQALSRRFSQKIHNPATGQTAALLDHVFTQAARLAKAIREEETYSAFYLVEKGA